MHDTDKLASKMEHSNMKHTGPSHNPIDVSTWALKPSLRLTAHQDAMSSWNVHIEPTHFEFAPDQVNSANVIGRGNVHINGEKITRLYSNGAFPGINAATDQHGVVTLARHTDDSTEKALVEKIASKIRGATDIRSSIISD